MISQFKKDNFNILGQFKNQIRKINLLDFLKNFSKISNLLKKKARLMIY